MQKWPWPSSSQRALDKETAGVKLKAQFADNTSCVSKQLSPPICTRNKHFFAQMYHACSFNEALSYDVCKELHQIMSILVAVLAVGVSSY